MHRRHSPLALATLAFVALGAHPRPGAAADAAPNELYGRVTVRGRGLPAGRVVRVEASSGFPLFATPPSRSVTTNKKGEFSIGKLPDGFYWVVAYLDDDKDGRRGPGEICGFPRTAPVFAGPDHRRVRVPIEIDPVHAIVATRFRRGTGKEQPARLELAFAALYARHPATGAPLVDAEVTLEEDGQARPLAYDPAFPGGAHVAYGDARRAPERFVFLVAHPALGKGKRRVALHSRTLGAVPVIAPTLSVAPPAGQDLRVEWHQPAWANFATVEVYELGTPGGPRRVWPAGLGDAAAFDGSAVVPAALLTPGRRLRLDVVAGRADVRTENGQIWATAAAEREVTVGRPVAAAPRPAGAPGPAAPPRGPTGASGNPAPRPAGWGPAAPAPGPAAGSRP